MIDVTITMLPSAPLHALETWSNPAAVSKRFMEATGFTLPQMGKSGGNDALRLIRYEPTVWIVEGGADALPAILGDDGAVTAIGGGVKRVRLSGIDWRRLLMEGGMFDAESPSFAVGCCAATLIDHVAVRLHVVSENVCDVYVPSSFSGALIDFWKAAVESC